MLDRSVMYDGKEEMTPEQTEVYAGPLSLLYEQGDLRSIRWGDLEILRRVYVAVRDRNWGTIAPVFQDVEVAAGEHSFQIRYRAENRLNEIAFAWRGEIRGEPDGTLVFSMEGEALTTFLKNRIGFCVLHPAAAAGKRCRVEHTDGTQEEGVLPVDISSDQPVLPFANMRSLSYETGPGLWVDVAFQGDVFEMEDQRNWTDASYKTFCTPLALPYPIEIKSGTRVAQRIIIRVRSEQKSAQAQPRTENQPVSLRIDPDGAWKRVPEIGLGSASHAHPLEEREIERLRALHLHHLRVDLLLSDPGFRSRLERAALEAHSLGIGLEIALLVSENMEEEMVGFCQAFDAVRPPVCSWLVYPARERYQGGSPTREVVQAARAFLNSWMDHVPLGTGSNADFIFLKRTAQPVDLVDRIAVSMNPQVHAFDNLSLVETLEAQPAVVHSARCLAGELPVAVSPVTLKPRFNPYTTGAAPVPAPGVLPFAVDARQMSLFGAGWTLGSLSALLSAGAASLTYYETTGWRGVMETSAGSPLPHLFRSIPGAVFPLYHVLADAGAFAWGEGQPLSSSRSLAVSGLALRAPGRWAVLLANHTAQPQRIRLEGLPDSAGWLRMLDEKVAEEAMTQPEAYRSRNGVWVEYTENRLETYLLPYAFAGLYSQAGE